MLEQWRLNRERYAISSMVLMLSGGKVRIGLGWIGLGRVRFGLGWFRLGWFCFVWFYIVLFCIVLFCIVLFCFVLYSFCIYYYFCLCLCLCCNEVISRYSTVITQICNSHTNNRLSCERTSFCILYLKQSLIPLRTQSLYLKPSLIPLRTQSLYLKPSLKPLRTHKLIQGDIGATHNIHTRLTYSVIFLQTIFCGYWN